MTSIDTTHPPATLRVFIVCDQTDTAPIWGYMIREKGLVAIIETSVQRAMERAVEDIPDLIIIDVNASHEERIARITAALPEAYWPARAFLAGDD